MLLSSHINRTVNVYACMYVCVCVCVTALAAMNHWISFNGIVGEEYFRFVTYLLFTVALLLLLLLVLHLMIQ